MVPSHSTPMTWSGRSDGSSSSVSTRPSWRDSRASGRGAPVGPTPPAHGSAPSSASTVGATSTRRRGPGHEAVLAHAGPRQDERRPHLHGAERPVLAPLAALVLPVVGRAVQAHEIGGGGVVEQLGDLLVRVRVGLLRAVGPAVGQLVVERREPVGGGVAQRVAALDLDVDEAPHLPDPRRRRTPRPGGGTGPARRPSEPRRRRRRRSPPCRRWARVRRRGGRRPPDRPARDRAPRRRRGAGRCGPSASWRHGNEPR